LLVRELFSFPNPVNEVAARVVAAGVVLLSVTLLTTGWTWLLVPLALGFLARVLTGPTLSPLGRLATQVVAPALPVPAKFVPGPPKRFAQGIGATLSTAAVVLHFGFGATTAASVLVAMIAGAAFLEAAFAFCLGCHAFALLMRMGVVPAEVCEECNDIWSRQPEPV
jgi:hypothetical protein